MSVTTTSRDLRGAGSAGVDASVHGRLPRWATPAVLAAAAAFGLLLLPLGVFNVALYGVLTAFVYTAGIYAWSRTAEGARRAKDRVVTAVVTSSFVVALVPLLSVVWTVVSYGVERFDVEFFTYSMRGIVGEGGGIYHAIIGTLLITGFATVISVPIGLMASIYLVEYGRGRLARAITFFVDVMTGIPSIVAGLFAYALFVIFFGPGVRMGAAGAVALSVLMIPVVIRSTEEILRIVPNELREASYALGVPKWRTIVKVVLPTSVAGIATGVTLAIARITGETAPLLIVAGATTSTNFGLFDGRIATLPVFTYYSYATPGVPREPYLDRAWAAALTLILIVMTLNLLARLISRYFAPQTGR